MKNNTKMTMTQGKRIHIELGSKPKVEGYTTRANINADCIHSMRRWKKDYGKRIADCLRRGDAKNAVKYMSWASGMNRSIRAMSENHDKLIYDRNGELYGIFTWTTDNSTYTFED